MYNILVRRPNGKRPLRRPRLRWNDILKWISGNRVGVCGLDSFDFG
jgi:hypothetical protein